MTRVTEKDRRIGIILGAGIGSRFMVSGTASLNKLLAPVANVALLLRAVYSLEVALCERIIIVLGCDGTLIQEYISSHYDGSADLQFVLNRRFTLKNGISLLCARDLVDGEYILTMGDHILDDQIMKLASNHSPPNAGVTLCVDYKLDNIVDIEDATKVLAAGDIVKEIGKNLKTYNCIDTGVFIATDALMDAICQIDKKAGDASLSEGVQLLAEAGRVEALDIKDAFWQDVDTPEMLAHAEILLQEHAEKVWKAM